MLSVTQSVTAFNVVHRVAGPERETSSWGRGDVVDLDRRQVDGVFTQRFDEAAGFRDCEMSVEIVTGSPVFEKDEPMRVLDVSMDGVEEAAGLGS